MSGFLRRLSVVLLVIAACFAGVRIYAAGSSSSSYYYTLNDDGAKVAAVPHSWAMGTVTQLSSLPYKPGYGFAGYYTGSGCTGNQIIDYTGVVLTSLNASTTLYACWRALNPIWDNTPLVVLSDNGGSGGAFASSCGTDFWTNSLHNEYVSYGHRGDWAYIDMPRGYYWWASPCTMTYSTVTTMASLPTRSGYTFNGYYTGQNGTGTRVVYANGNLVDADTLRNVLSSSVPTTIYAYWTVDNSGHYRITLNDAGGSGSQVSSMGTEYNLYEGYDLCYEAGTGINLSTGAPLNAVCIANIYATPTKTGYDFGGYYTGQNGSGVPIINSSGTIVGSNTQFTAPATIYAKWTPKVLSVKLNHQSPTNSPAPSEVYLKYATGWYSDAGATTSITHMTTVPTKTNYTFGGYWTGQNGSGTRVIDTDGNFIYTTAALTALSTVGTVYAYWTSSVAQPTWVTVTINDQSATTNSQPTVLYRNTNTAVSGCSGYKASRSCSAATVTSITPPTKTNYTYGGHYTSTGGSGSQWTNANGTILYNVTANTIVYAKWTQNSSGTVVAVKLDSNGGTPANQTIYFRTGLGWYADSAGAHQITSSIFNSTSTGGAGLTRPTNSGYTFNGYWTDASAGSVAIDSNGNIVIDAPNSATRAPTYYARWTRSTSTVTLNPNGGTACSTTQVTAINGSPMPALSCAPTRANYTFTGYFDAQTGGTQYYNADLTSARNWDKTGNETLYAQWEESTYAVRYFCTDEDLKCYKEDPTDPSCHMYTDTARYTQNYVFKTLAVTGCTTPSGQKFLGWADISDGNVYAPGQIEPYPYQSDADLIAYNKPIVTVTLAHNSPDNTPSPSTVYLVPTDAWYTDSDATNEISTMATVPVKYGYNFLGYYTASSGGTKIIDANGSFVNVPTSSLTTLYARYSAKRYPFTLNDASATTASSPNPVTYKVGVGWVNNSTGMEITSITIPTKTGNSFAGFWTGPNGTGTKIINADGAFVTITSGILREFNENNVDTLYAKWNPKYTVTFSCVNQAGNGSGTPSPATVYVADGETLTFPALTNCSWGNAGMSPYMWGVVSGDTFTDTHDAGDTITWDSSWGDRTYNVWYAPNYFDYEYSCDAGSGTPPANGNTYYHNGGWKTAVNTCTAPANKHFVGWLEPVSGVTYAENTTPTGGGWIWPYNVTAAAGGAFVAQYADDTYTAHFTCENNTFSPYVYSGTAPDDITDVAYQSTISLPSPNVCTNNYPDAGWIVSPATEWLYSCTDGNGGALGGGTAGAGSWTWPKQGNCTFRPNALYSTYHISYYCDGTTNTVSLDQTVDYTNRDTVRPATVAAAGCSTPTGHHFKNWTVSGTNVSGTMNPGAYGGSGDLWPYATTVNLRAQWEPDTYNLTWSCGNGTGTPSGAAFPTSINYGDSLTFPANTVCTAPTGYQFTSWVIDINATEYAPNDTFTWNLTDGSAITAHYEPVKVNINYYCGTDATGTPPAAQNNINYGSSVTLQALGNCAKTGHTADKWVVSNTSPAASYNFGATVNPWNYTENKTLTPNWSAQTYTITYELNGGTQASSGMPTSYTYGTTTTINGVPTLVGAEFAGWCDTESLTNCAMTKTISATTTGNKKFWAKWTCKTGYEANDVWLTDGYPLIHTFTNGTIYGGAACVPGRYHITCDGNGGVACLEQVTENATYQEHLGQVYDTYLVDFGEFSGVSGVTTVSSANSDSINALINDGSGMFVFTKNPPSLMRQDVSWSTHDGNYNNLVNSLAPSGMTPFVRAHYTYDGLWTERNGGVQYIPASGNVPWGYNMTGAGNFSRFFTSNSTVYAHWIPDVYTILLDAEGYEGTLSAVYETYNTGWSQTLAGTPGAWVQLTAAQMASKPGYTLLGYYSTASGTGTKYINGDGTLASGVTPTTFGESTTLHARFQANTYNVTYLCGTDATGTAPASATATYDANFTPASIGGCTNPGRSFAGWLVSNTGNPSDTKQAGTAFQWKYTEDKTFTAQWTDNTYTITFHPGDGVTTTGTTEVKEWYSHAYRVQSGTGSMSWTAVTEITLPTKTGYTFAGYYNNPSFTGTPVMTDATLPVTTPTATYFTADADLYAKWTKTGYAVTYKNGGGTGNDVIQDVSYDTQFTTKPGSIFTKTNYVVTKWNTTSGGNYPNLNSGYTYSTAGNTVLTANWGECQCTKGTHVALCDVTDVANNTCQYSYTCEAGYNNAGATSGTFNGNPDTATNPSPNCGGANSYTITVTAGNGISKVAASGWTNTGTATMTKTFDFGEQIDLSSVVTPTQKSGYTGVKYEKTDGAGSISGNVYTVGAGNGTITVSATGITAPAGVTITGGTTKVYNLSATTLTGATTTTYDSGITVKYSFGYASASNGTYGNWTTASTTKTTSIAKDAFLGTRYYKVRVTASDGTLTSTTTTATTPATMTLDQKKITFNATTNGGTLSGTSPLYVRYDSANVYTGATSTTTGTVPTATKTGYTFNGWYTEQTDGSQIYNASGTLTSATVSGWTGLSKWQATEDKTLYAQFSANTNTPYKVYHYTKNLTGTGYTLNGAVDNLTGTSNASVTLESLARALPGFTYDAGFETTISNGTHGTTKPSSGAVTTTTILPDGTRIIDLYYNRNSYTITYKNGGGTGSDVTQPGISYMGSFTTKPGTTFTKTNSIMTGWNTTSGGTYPNLASNYTYSTAGDTVLTANWDTCQCTEGTGVASCTTSATATNTCAATVTCASGYDQSTATWSCSGATCSSSCSADDFEITLNNANATTNGTAKIYTTYGVNVYLDANRSKVMTTSANPITTPKRVYTVTYNGNNGTVGTTTAANTTATYTFKGYYSAATNGTQYIVGSTGRITSNGITAGKGYSANATWYAQWTSASVTLPNATRAGYTFAGWYDKATGGNLIGAAGATYTPIEDKTLYAHWNECTTGNYCDGTGTVTSCSTATNGKYPHSAAGSTSINDCYLTTTAGKYVATAGDGEVQCVANDYCVGGVNVYYGGTHSTTHPTKGGNASCSSGTDNKYNYSAAGTDTVNNCYLTLTTGKYVASAGAGMTNCAANNYSDDTTTKVYYGGTASSSHPTTSSCAACSTLGGGLYNKSAGGTGSTGCYVTTTAGKYIIENTDTAQTTCPVKKYCESATIYWPNVGQIADCPEPNASTMRTTYPANYYNVLNASISWGAKTGATSISQCRAIYFVTNERGKFYHTQIEYNPVSGKYDSGNGVQKYYIVYNPGYYGTEKLYSNSSCSSASTTTRMYYQDAQPCPEGSYCPGLNSMPLCSSGTYAETIGLYSCPTNYPDSAAMSTNINACYLTTTAGKYVATAGDGEVQCSANNYCTGGVVVHYDEIGGITACSTGAGSNYATSAAGSDSNTDCYKTVTLDKNGGSGTIQGTSGTNPASVVCHYNTECNFGSASGLSQTGYTFSGGWGTSASCSDTTTSYTVPNETSTYYACKSQKDYTMQYLCSDGTESANWSFAGTAPVATNPVHYGQSVILAGDIYAQQNGCRKVWGTSSDADYCDDCFTFGGWRIDAESTAIPSAPVHMANSTVNPWGRTNTTDWCIISDTGNCLGFADDVFYVRPKYTPKQYNIEYMYATGPVSGASANMPASYTYTTETTISNADQTAPAHAIFNGWCTNLNDASTCVAAGQPITIGNRNHGDMRYYANWTCDAGYTLTYDANNQPVCSADAMTCDPGYYLQGSSATCQPCLVGDYCEGGNFVHNGTDQGLKVCATEIATGWTSLGGTACTAKTSCYYPVTLNKNGFTGTITAGAGTGCTVAATVTGTNPATLRLFYNTACTLPSITLTQTGYTNATKWSEQSTLNATAVSTIDAVTTTPAVTTYYAQKTTCKANYYTPDNTTCMACSGLAGGAYSFSAVGTGGATSCYAKITLNKNGYSGRVLKGAGTGCKVAANANGTTNATLNLFYNTACTLPTFTTGLTQTGYTNATKWSEFNTIDATTVSTIPASTTAPTITTYYAQKPSCAANYYKNDTTTCSLCSGLGGGLYTKSAAGNKIDNTVCYSTVTAGTYIVNNTDSAVTECPGGSYCIGGNVYWPNVGNIDSCPDGYDLGDTGLSAQNQCQTSCPAGQCLPVAGGSCVDAGVGNWSAGGLVGYGSTLACNVCPTGLTTIGYGAGADEADDCGRVLHMGENRLYLRGAFRTTPSLRVKVGDNVFYGNMSTTLKNMSDGINKKLRLKYNGTTYSVYDDSVGE